MSRAVKNKRRKEGKSNDGVKSNGMGGRTQSKGGNGVKSKKG